MKAIIVVENPASWPFQIPGVPVVAARKYLTDERYSEGRGLKVFNLCRSYRYQSVGYYVSLLAAARGHKPMPSLTTIQDLKALEIVRIRSDELEDLIERSLAHITAKSFELSIYFGRNTSKRYDRLAQKLFQSFYAPLLRACFMKRGGRWVLQSVQPIAAADIPEHHHPFVLDLACQYFTSGRWIQPRKRTSRWDLAILYNPKELEPPSNEKAIHRFMRAAQDRGISPFLIGKDEYTKLAQYDALFIRETTNVHHHTYRFARRAQAEGMVVIDDPDSILRCTNKVYLKELLDRHRVPAPKTMVVHPGNIRTVARELGLPVILKKPDSAFSQGVIKVDSEEELRHHCERMFNGSELLIAQQFMPTEFDWRVGIIGGKALWCSKYYMVDRHWQIMKWEGTEKSYGRDESLPIDDAPPEVVKTALRAASLIGDGLYGVDLKTVGRKTYVVEVNDNPSIEAGVEDTALGMKLYERIMDVFLERMETRRVK